MLIYDTENFETSYFSWFLNNFSIRDRLWFTIFSCKFCWKTFLINDCRCYCEKVKIVNFSIWWINSFDLAPKISIGCWPRSRGREYVTGVSTTRVGARKWAHKSKCERERDVHKACLAGSVNHYLASPMTPSSSAAFLGNAREQEDRCVGPPIKCRDIPPSSPTNRAERTACRP